MTTIAEFKKTTEQDLQTILSRLDPKEFYARLDNYLGEADRANTVDFYALLRRYHDAIDSQLAEVKKVVAHLEENILPDLLRDEDEFGMGVGFRTEKSPHLGYTVYIGTENYVSLPDKPAAFEFLRANDYASAIEESVHHKRLPSIYKEIVEKGIEIPPEMFRVSTKHKARLRNN